MDPHVAGSPHCDRQLTRQSRSSWLLYWLHKESQQIAAQSVQSETSWMKDKSSRCCRQPGTARFASLDTSRSVRWRAAEQWHVARTLRSARWFVTHSRRYSLRRFAVLSLTGECHFQVITELFVECDAMCLQPGTLLPIWCHVPTIRYFVTNVTPCASSPVLCYQCDAMCLQPGTLLPIWCHVPAVR